jgi:hypothetical protein
VSKERRTGAVVAERLKAGSLEQSMRSSSGVRLAFILNRALRNP